MIGEALQNYLDNGFNVVDGFCIKTALEITGHIVSWQKMRGIHGGACEIGVLYGKFLIGLANAVEDCRSLAIDIFDDQSLNVDGSGSGFLSLRDTFRDNVRHHCARADLISEMARDSLGIGPYDILSIAKQFSPFQLFSIDGGHTPEHVINDYSIASQLTHPGGLIIVDDILNSAWPGVIEGVARLFLFTRPKFVPICIGHNKLFLTGLSYHDESIRLLREEVIPQLGIPNGMSQLFGHYVVTL